MEVNDIRQRILGGLDAGDFTLGYLWIRFWAKGGRAGRVDLDAFVHGLRELSENDALVLDSLAEELHFA